MDHAWADEVGAELAFSEAGPDVDGTPESGAMADGGGMLAAPPAAQDFETLRSVRGAGSIRVGPRGAPKANDCIEARDRPSREVGKGKDILGAETKFERSVSAWVGRVPLPMKTTNVESKTIPNRAPATI